MTTQTAMLTMSIHWMCVCFYGRNLPAAMQLNVMTTAYQMVIALSAVVAALQRVNFSLLCLPSSCDTAVLKLLLVILYLC